ncbi:MAG: nucleoside-diphosphate kinase [Chloroflexota bacterium]
MERSLVFIKPDAVVRGLSGTILGRLEKEGLKLTAARMLKMDQAMAQKHYAVHAGKPFFSGLVEYITSGPIVAAVFEGEDAVARIRNIMGKTDPAQAEAGTIRRDFGQNIEQNAIHGSDSVETADKEIRLFFRESEITTYQKIQG